MTATETKRSDVETKKIIDRETQRIKREMAVFDRQKCTCGDSHCETCSR